MCGRIVKEANKIRDGGLQPTAILKICGGERALVTEQLFINHIFRTCCKLKEAAGWMQAAYLQ